jgi:hypothetical protein
MGRGVGKVKKAVYLALGLLLLVAGSARSSEVTVLEFGTMVAVTGPFVGSANAIRGINGGGLPWVISEGHGGLQRDGKLEVQVRGLVLFNGPPVPVNLQGTNPVVAFRAVVSCLTIVGGLPATKNVSTDSFPATPDGNADIEVTISLPSPCFAPIVFVTNGTVAPPGAWFAVAGF